MAEVVLEDNSTFVVLQINPVYRVPNVIEIVIRL